jgi:arsenate reductase-like glutaredoxin family protein
MSNERVMPIVIYGIKTCDTMKKARAFLSKRIIDGATGTIEWE